MEKEKKETKEEKQTSKKESKGLKTTSFQITLIVILLICCAGLGGWVLGASKVNLLYRDAINKNNTNSNTTKKTNTTNDNTTTNQETKEEKDEIKPLDLTKSLNTSNIEYTDAKELEEGRDVGGLSIKHNGSDLKLVIDWPKFGPNSGASAWSQEPVEYEIKNLSGTVRKAFVSGIGQDITGTKLFYLMEDGTVEYTDVFSRNFDSKGTLYFNVNYTYEKDSNERITGEHFESQGKISGVKDVIKLYSVNARGGMSGYVTVIGATRDGSFYDLGNIISK